MVKIFFLSIIVLCFMGIFTCSKQYEGCYGTENNQPLLIDEPKLINQISHGQFYQMDYDGRLFSIIVLNGTAYEMGYAYGKLIKNEINKVIPEFFEFMENFLKTNITFISKLPIFLKNIVGKTGLELVKILINIDYLITKKYTHQRWEDEYRGIADGSGCSRIQLIQLNLLSELTKAWCSTIGAYGDATKSGKLLQIRALDWEEHASIHKYPAVIIYHPTEPNSIPFANIGWIGAVGSYTGYNAAKIGVGERMGDGAFFDDTTYFGTPWMYVLRDMMQFAGSLDQALKFLHNQKRTAKIYLGVGSGFDNDYRIIEYSSTYLNIYDYKTWPYHRKDAQHPQMKDVLWMEYRDETNCFKNVIENYYGKIDSQVFYRILAPLAQTGDSQLVVMDYENDVLYIQYPHPITFEPGYARPIIRLDLKIYFTSNKILKDTQDTFQQKL